MWRFTASLTRWASSINRGTLPPGSRPPGRSEVVRRALSGVEFGCGASGVLHLDVELDLLDRPVRTLLWLSIDVADLDAVGRALDGTPKRHTWQLPPAPPTSSPPC